MLEKTVKNIVVHLTTKVYWDPDSNVIEQIVKIFLWGIKTLKESEYSEISL